MERAKYGVWLRGIAAIGLCSLAGLCICGCISKVPPNGSGTGAATGASSGSSTSSGISISIHGSSTVYPISQAVAEAYKAKNPAVEIDVGQSGTSGGFKKFVSLEADICDASRPIKEAEMKLCAEKGIEYLELNIAVDALTVAVNPANDWVDCLSASQLKRIWEPGSTVQKWNDIDPSWPDQEIKLFGADTDSGTFDYFTEAINGKEDVSRSDYTANSNDNVLVQGVAEEKYSLGYFGYGYYAENQQRLKSLKIKATDGGECIAPTTENVDADLYKPLARPLFIYVNKAALKRPEVAGYLQFYLSDEGQAAVVERKFIRVRSSILEEMRQRLDEALAAAK